MAKGKRRSSGAGGLLSKGNLIRTGVTVAVGAYVFNMLSKSAADASKKDSIQNKVAGALGFTGPGIS